jgi:hypothetical protein
MEGGEAAYMSDVRAWAVSISTRRTGARGEGIGDDRTVSQNDLALGDVCGAGDDVVDGKADARINSETGGRGPEATGCLARICMTW